MADKPISGFIETDPLQDNDEGIVQRGASTNWKYIVFSMFTYVYSKIIGRTVVVVNTATDTTLLANTYANGILGVGATLTANANGAIGSFGGIVLTVNMRVLVKDETDFHKNGVYSVTSLGSAGTPWVLTRTTDADSSSENDDQVVAVKQGTQVGVYTQITTLPVMGTSHILYLKGDSARAVISTTALNFKNLLETSTLKFPRTYIITDIGEAGIVINTNSSNSTDGVGIAIRKCPKYGDYPIWYTGLAVTINEYYIWNHKVWRSVTGTSNQPHTNSPTHWVEVVNTDATYYDSDFDACKYQPIGMYLEWREGGAVYAEGINTAQYFPFGKPGLTGKLVNAAISVALANTKCAFQSIQAENINQFVISDSLSAGAIGSAMYGLVIKNCNNVNILTGNLAINNLQLVNQQSGSTINVVLYDLAGTDIIDVSIENFGDMSIKSLQNVSLKNIKKVLGASSPLHHTLSDVTAENLTDIVLTEITSSTIRNCNAGANLENYYGPIEHCEIQDCEGYDLLTISDCIVKGLNSGAYNYLSNSAACNIQYPLTMEDWDLIIGLTMIKNYYGYYRDILADEVYLILGGALSEIPFSFMPAGTNVDSVNIIIRSVSDPTCVASLSTAGEGADFFANGEDLSGTIKPLLTDNATKLNFQTTSGPISFYGTVADSYFEGAISIIGNTVA